MALNVETFIKEIESMSVLELNGLVKALEEKFGVSAAMMAAPAAAPSAAAPSGKPEAAASAAPPPAPPPGGSRRPRAP